MFIDFIRAYWREILEVVVVVVSIIICCIRKKPIQVIENVKGALIDLIPQLINIAEVEFGSGNGQKKFDFVFKRVQEWFEMNNFQFTEFYKKTTRLIIEEVLATPQKK